MKTTIRRFGLLAFLPALVVGLCAPPSHAAELAGIMPKESVLYLEWSGTDAVREAQAATALGKLMGEPEMQRFAAELEKGVNRLVAAPQAGPELKKIGMGAQMAKPLVQHLWHHRVALSIIGTENTDTGPSVAAALAVELGKDGEGFVTAFQGLLNMATMQAAKHAETVGNYTFQRVDLSYFPPIRYGTVDDVFLVTMGADVVKDILDVKSGTAPGLAAQERFAAARRKLGATPANTTLLLHLDLLRLRDQIKPFLLGHSGSAEFPPPVPTLLEELGVNSLQTVTFTGQLADGGCRNAIYLATTGPAKGLLKLFEAKPLTDEDFHAVPADAPFFEVCNFPLGNAYDEAVRIAGVLAPEAVADLTQQFEQLTGMKLREDVLGLFDDGWAIFDAPSQGGLWFTGLHLVLETQDAEAFVKMLDNLAGVLRKKVGDTKLSLKHYEHNGLPIHYVSITVGPVPVAPAWGAQGKRVVLALFPQMVAQTLDQLAAPDVQKRCILANPDFVRGRKLLPPTSSAVAYVNTKDGAENLYTLFLPAATAGCSFAAANGVPLDVSTIPSAPVMTRHLFGDVRSVSRDEEGVLFVGHGPLPLPIPSFGAGGGVATSAMMVSILLPSLSRARELSKRAVSQANLQGIGTACHVYAFDHQEKFPPDLETLVAEGSVTHKMLVSPRDGRDPPPGNCSYVYLAGQTLKSDPRNVLAYEPDFEGEGGNVLFVDGHVEWIKPPRFQQMIDETRARLGAQPSAK
ncbi:MAG: H-X9-DG-CTERM domain-containing protein [Planctomycetota bacterium]